MPRPAAATPAAHVRSILKFFESTDIQLADVVFELIRTSLAERRANRKAKSTAARGSRSVAVQTLAVPETPAATPEKAAPAAAAATAATPTVDAEKAAAEKRKKKAAQERARQARKKAEAKRAEKAAAKATKTTDVAEEVPAKLPPQRKPGEGEEDAALPLDDGVSW
jgi:hypothetical protein